MLTKEQIEAVRADAASMRQAVSGVHTEGTFHAANWADKPHRVLYDCIKHVDDLARTALDALALAEKAEKQRDALIEAERQAHPTMCAMRRAQTKAEADRDRLAAQLAEAQAQMAEWKDVVSWLDNGEKTIFDWCAGGAHPEGEFSCIGLRRETPDGQVLYRAYTADGPWEAPALATHTGKEGA